MTSIRGAAVSLLFLLAGVPVCPRPAAAFDSFPWGAPHDRITRSALGALGFADSRTDQVVQEVRDADWTQVRWDPALLDPGTWTRIGTNDAYRAGYHFDRGAETSHALAFAAGVTFVRTSRTEAIRAATEEREADAIHHLGRGLHAVQDLLSHSNYADLMPADRAVVREAVFGDGEIVPPAALKITGYDPGARDPERPVDDGYPHRDFAKDGPRKNAEAKARGADDRTKFEAAFEAAVELSEKFLAGIRDGVRPAVWDGLRGV